MKCTCTEDMVLEWLVDVALDFFAGDEALTRLQRLHDAGVVGVWHCFGCGFFITGTVDVAFY